MSDHGGGHGKPKKPAGGHGGGHGGGLGDSSIPGWQLAILGMIAIVLLVMFYTGQIGPTTPTQF